MVPRLTIWRAWGDEPTTMVVNQLNLCRTRVKKRGQRRGGENKREREGGKRARARVKDTRHTGINKSSGSLLLHYWWHQHCVWLSDWLCLGQRRRRRKAKMSEHGHQQTNKKKECRHPRRWPLVASCCSCTVGNCCWQNVCQNSPLECFNKEEVAVAVAAELIRLMQLKWKWNCEFIFK
mgnify:CR=1 FL=1